METHTRTEIVAYLREHDYRYLEWCSNVLYSPYTPLDKLEFSIISAHCAMDTAIRGFKNSRDVMGLSALATVLADAGVMAPFNKAGYIDALREALATGEIIYPYPPYQDYRRDNKLPGLGYCKLSFGISLIDPFEATTVCLDTHILQLLLGYRPGSNEMNRIYRRANLYEELEDVIKYIADEAQMPMFLAQWGMWDWKRSKYDLLPPNDHSFLWKTGPTTEQLELI